MGKRKPAATLSSQQQKQTQQPPKPNKTKQRPTLTLQRRNEQQELVAELLRLVFTEPTNPNDEWKLFLDVQKLLNRLMELEAPLRRFYTKQPTPEQRLRNIDAFYKWATENGVKYQGLEIAEFPGFDLGLKATSDIGKNDLLFSVPRKVILTEETIDSNDTNAKIFQSMSNINLSYALMIELMNPNSFWKPYLDLLPQSYNTALYFTVEQMEELKGSNVLSHALKLCISIARQYAFISKCSQTSAPASLKKTVVAENFKEQFSYEMYRWAVSTVMTRQNLIPRSQKSGTEPAGGEVIAALIPFWDMANHRYGHVTSFYNMETHEMDSTSQQPVKAGEQIFMHYGDRSNANLMTHNGFLDPANPKDSVSIRLGLSPSDPLYEQRSKLLKLLDIAKNTDLDVVPGPDFISSKLLAFVRVFNMNAEQLEHWIDSERAMDLLHIDCALDTSLDTKTWQYLRTRLMLLLRVFPTTLQEDEQLLQNHEDGSKPLGYIKGMILQYRVFEKRILTAALAYAEQRSRA